jgi:hypothetical protein
MDLSNKIIPVLRPTKIQPPRSFVGFGGFGAGGHAPTQKHPSQVAFGSVPAGPSAFGQTATFPQAQPTQPMQSQNAFGASGVFGSSTQTTRRVPPPPAAPSAFGQAAVFPQAQPTQPMQSNTFGASGLFGSSAQTMQPDLPPQPSLFGSTRDLNREITQSAATPVDEWQDIEGEDATADEEQTNVIGEPTSVVHESPLALTYHVEGASGVPSDGVPHQVTIAVLPFEAKIQHVTIPKVRPVAYLQATVKNTSDYRLLPGTVHAFVDDSFVSKTGIVGDVAPGDVLSCTLGADPPRASDTRALASARMMMPRASRLSANAAHSRSSGLRRCIVVVRP